LKSILKGGAEDRTEPNSLSKIKEAPVPRTNPVNLLFIICQSAAKIAELHFPAGKEFHDLVMKTNLTSQSRARAFLWLMWHFLESDFTEEGCDENPFGAGVDYGVSVANQGVPNLEEMTADEEAQENIDPQEEIDFGYQKQKMRAKILEVDQAYLAEDRTKRGSRARVVLDDGPAILPRIRPSKHESDMDSTRSTPPPRALARGLGGSSRRGAGSLKYQIYEASSPAGPSHQMIEGIVARKPRPPTAHQLAVERNRNQRVEYILDRGLRRKQHRARKIRRQDGSIYRAWKRVQEMQDPFENSDGEDGPQQFSFSEDRGTGNLFRGAGIGGLVLLKSEDDDFGEQANTFAAAIRRAHRRLNRWDAYEGPALGVIPPTKRKKKVDPDSALNGGDGDLDGMDGKGDLAEYGDMDIDGDEDGPDTQEIEVHRPKPRGKGRGKLKTKGRSKAKATANGNDVIMEGTEDGDDADTTQLGAASGANGEEKEEEEIDDLDRTLLADGESDAD
jgi:Ino eighty subunit 1